MVLLEQWLAAALVDTIRYCSSSSSSSRRLIQTMQMNSSSSDSSSSLILYMHLLWVGLLQSCSLRCYGASATAAAAAERHRQQQQQQGGRAGLANAGRELS
jgi:hypothetical protein